MPLRTPERKEKIMAKAKATKKKAVKTASKKTAAKKTSRKAAMAKGSKYTCGVCGLAVTVDTACGCAETAHLICCERPMRKKK